MSNSQSFDQAPFASENVADCFPESSMTPMTLPGAPDSSQLPSAQDFLSAGQSAGVVAEQPATVGDQESLAYLTSSATGIYPDQESNWSNAFEGSNLASPAEVHHPSSDDLNNPPPDFQQSLIYSSTPLDNYPNVFHPWDYANTNLHTISADEESPWGFESLAQPTGGPDNVDLFAQLNNDIYANDIYATAPQGFDSPWDMPLGGLSQSSALENIPSNLSEPWFRGINSWLQPATSTNDDFNSTLDHSSESYNVDLHGASYPTFIETGAPDMCSEPSSLTESGGPHTPDNTSAHPGADSCIPSGGNETTLNQAAEDASASIDPLYLQLNPQTISALKPDMREDPATNDVVEEISKNECISLTTSTPVKSVRTTPSASDNQSISDTRRPLYYPLTSNISKPNGWKRFAHVVYIYHLQGHEFDAIALARATSHFFKCMTTVYQEEWKLGLQEQLYAPKEPPKSESSAENKDVARQSQVINILKILLTSRLITQLSPMHLTYDSKCRPCLPDVGKFTRRRNRKGGPVKPIPFRYGDEE